MAAFAATTLAHPGNAHLNDRASVLAAMHVGVREIAMYGCIGPGEVDGDLVRVLSIVEKPDPADAPSDLAVIGRYVLAPAIFDALRRTTPGAGGEIQLTDAMLALLKGQPFYAVKYEGRTFDCGSKVGFLTANVACARARPDIAEAFKAEIKKLV